MAIGIINFANPFLNFIDDTMIRYLNSRLDLSLSCPLSYFKSLLRQGLPEPKFYGALVYILKKIVGSNNFSAQFINIICHY